MAPGVLPPAAIGGSPGHLQKYADMSEKLGHITYGGQGVPRRRPHRGPWRVLRREHKHGRRGERLTEGRGCQAPSRCTSGGNRAHQEVSHQMRNLGDWTPFRNAAEVGNRFPHFSASLSTEDEVSDLDRNIVVRARRNGTPSFFSGYEKGTGCLPNPCRTYPAGLRSLSGTPRWRLQPAASALSAATSRLVRISSTVSRTLKPSRLPHTCWSRRGLLWRAWRPSRQVCSHSRPRCLCPTRFALSSD
jgi:hypothetical protein